MLMLLCVGAASAETNEKRLGVWDSENRHSLSLSVGFESSSKLYTSREWDSAGLQWMENEEENPNYYDYEEGSQFSMPAFSLNYFYRINRSFSVGCSVGYGHESTEINSIESGEYALTVRDNMLFVSPMIRLHWLNSRRLDMYSGFGIITYGLASTSNAYRIEGNSSKTEGYASQFTLVGINVKLDRTYIFSEYGVGAHGKYRFGVGYRF